MTIEAFFTVATGIHYCSFICSVHIEWAKVLRKVCFIDGVCKVIIVEEKQRNSMIINQVLNIGLLVFFTLI
jgi:hypothetical protein